MSTSTGTNGWDRNVERLLSNWSKQITINDAEYRKRGTRLRYWYRGFGAFIVIAQTGVLTSLVNAIATASIDKFEQLLIILIILGIMETIITVVQGLDKFFDFSARAERFFVAANNHNALGRLIDSTLAIPRIDRDSAKQVLLAIREQFDQLVRDSPDLPPNSMIHRLDMCIYENPQEARGVTIAPTAPATATATATATAPAPAGTDTSTVQRQVAVDLVKIEPVQLPIATPTEFQDQDEETVSISQLHKLRARLQQRRDPALDYQWERMQLHEETS